MRARVKASLLAISLACALATTLATAACGAPPAVTVATTGRAAATSAAAGSVPAIDRQVSFVVDGTTTYGTLHVPAHRRGQSLAAALLLPGSGPTDRNGDESASFQPRTLSLLAGVLGDAGVMTLRFDKYASGQTGGAAPGRLGRHRVPRGQAGQHGRPAVADRQLVHRRPVQRGQLALHSQR